MHILEKLFGSAAKVKIMRLFLFNPDVSYDVSDIETRAQVSAEHVRKEMLLLEKIGLVKRKVFSKDAVRKHGKKEEIIRVKSSGWTLNSSFYYMIPLQNFLIHVNPLKHQEIVKKVSRVGKLKLLIISGVFIQQTESRIDLLVVGDNLKKGSLENVIREIESEIGKELRYTYFETPDFQYRLGMCDKLIRDILDFPHEKIVDKLGIQ